MYLLGSHVGMSGKDMMLGSVKTALSYGANTFMLYTGAPQNTRRKKIEELNIPAARELMKENGIGRPSTRANIIETLFKRQYIRKDKKRILATTTGIELIDTIQNDLLKSAELTGQWEKKLRMIEDGTYQVADFMEELKAMVNEIVLFVRYSSAKTITVETPEEKDGEDKKTKKEREKGKGKSLYLSFFYLYLLF